MPAFDGQLQSYVTNITNDCLVGYRYLDFDGSEQKLTLSLKGKGTGEFRIFLSDEEDMPNTVIKAEVNSEVWENISVEIQPVSGKLPLRLRYIGDGMLELGSVYME